MKPGTEYELFVKEIYESILECNGIDNINVQHDVKMKGVNGVERQVDIFWEFELAGLKCVDSGWAKSNNYHETRFYFLSNEVLIEDKTNGSQITILSIINELSREKIGSNQKNEFLYSNAYLFTGTVRIKITKLTLTYEVAMW